MHIRNNLRGKKIAVIGASIAGSAVGVLLEREGAEVIVLERSRHPHTERGAGIAMPESMIEKYIALDLFDEDIPRLPIHSRAFLIKNPINNEQKEIWEQKFEKTFALNWSDVYRNLNKRLRSASCTRGVEVKLIEQTQNSCTVHSTTESPYQVDYVIAADGMDSTVRRNIFPLSSPSYANYIAWRGVVSESDVSDSVISVGKMLCYTFANGHLLLYRIPAGGNHQKNSTVINWLMYEYNHELSLSTFLVDREGKSHATSLPPGSYRNA